MRIGARSGAAVAAVAAVLTLGACGSDSSTTAADPAATPTSASPSAPSSSATPDPTSPTCATVWRNGRMLDTKYVGCATEAGWVKAQVYQCSDGHRMVTFAHAFYAQPGRKITRSLTTLAKDHAFRHTMAVCGA